MYGGSFRTYNFCRTSQIGYGKYGILTSQNLYATNHILNMCVLLHFQQTPAQTTTPSNQATVVFTSSLSPTGTGFRVQFTSIITPIPEAVVAN